MGQCILGYVCVSLGYGYELGEGTCLAELEVIIKKRLSVGTRQETLMP